MKVEDVLPSPVVEPLPPVADDPTPEPGEVFCGFCKCKLTQSKGQVLDMSAKAIGYLDTTLVIRDLRRDLRDEIDKRKKVEDERDALKPKDENKPSLTPGQDRW